MINDSPRLTLYSSWLATPSGSMPAFSSGDGSAGAGDPGDDLDWAARSCVVLYAPA
jgi:hypothetical protein